MTKLYCFVSLALLIFLPTGACNIIAPLANGESLQGHITVTGAFALYPLVTRWAEEYQKINPAVIFDIASGGAAKGMSDILDGKADIGMVSREITPDEEKLGVFAIPVAQDAVFALVNVQNPVAEDLLTRGLNRETLLKVFIDGEVTTWGQAVGRPEVVEEIHVYTRSDICGAATIWSLYLGGTQSDLLGEGKFGDPGMVQAIQNDPLGIGYNNLIYAYGLGDVPPEGTLILPIDLNNNGQADLDETLDTREKAVNAVETGLYPAPPSRTLYLVTNGKPEGAVQAFLAWVLAEGQEYVQPSGYVRLSTKELETFQENIR